MEKHSVAGTLSRAKRSLDCRKARRFDPFRARGRRALAFATTALALHAMAFSLPAAAQPALPLLSSVAADGAVADRTGERQVVRERRVSVNFRNIDPDSRAAPVQLGVELFDGLAITLEPDRVERRGPKDYTWHGKVRGFDRSQAILTVVGGRIAGTITYHDAPARKGAVFQIQDVPDGAPTLREIDQNAFPPDHPDGQANRVPALKRAGADVAARTGAPAGAAAVAAGDSGAIVDVMVVYSNQTALAAGTAIGAQIQNAVDVANAAYANSGIATRLRLVHYEQVAYSDSGDFITDLNRLTNAGDGYMDNVATLRNAYGADLVSLFVESAQYCGYAWIGPNADYAFSVVNRGCASSNYSFVHELGHNFGALHDPYVDPGADPYAYGHGLTDPGEAWRTVMAYNNACAAANANCTRIPYFSNPNMTYGSPAHALGTASTNDNARVHNQNAYTIANFRQAADGCTYALSPSGTSMGAAAGSGSFAVTSGTACAWNATSDAAWLTIGADSGVSGTGTLYYSAAANGGPARGASIIVGGQSFAVSQASGCTFTLSPASASVAAAGGSSSFALSTGAGCAWSASSGATWLTITSAPTGSGSATISFAVASDAGASRSANLTVGGASFIVSQAAVPGGLPVASISGSAVAFGNQTVGSTSATRSVTLTNAGAGMLTLSALTQGGANAAEFIRSGTCAIGTSLAAGNGCTLVYVFRPAATGNRAANLAIGTSAGTLNLSLTGKGMRK